MNEYILIGIPEQSGKMLESWGFGNLNQKPNYVEDNFEKVTLYNLERYQISSHSKFKEGGDRKDYDTDSVTFSFRRKDNL